MRYERQCFDIPPEWLQLGTVLATFIRQVEVCPENNKVLEQNYHVSSSYVKYHIPNVLILLDSHYDAKKATQYPLSSQRVGLILSRVPHNHTLLVPFVLFVRTTSHIPNELPA